MEIVRLRDDQLGEASEVLARAFQDDPAWIWLIPDERRRAAVLPWLFRVGFEIAAADVWTTAGSVRRLRTLAAAGPAADARRRGAAGLHRDAVADAGGNLALLRLRASAREHAHGGGERAALVPRRARCRARRSSARASARRSSRPGSRAQRASGLPCVLLTNDEQNLSFYERHGFETVLEGDKPPGGPHAWAMVRKPL